MEIVRLLRMENYSACIVRVETEFSREFVTRAFTWRLPDDVK